MPARRSSWAPWRNLVRNTEWAGAVAGTPGTPPRGVQLIDDPPMAGNGLGSQLLGVSSESGLRRLNWRFVGSALGQGNLAIALGPQLRVRPGEMLSHSCFVRFTALANAGALPQHTIQINEYDAAGGFLRANSVEFTPLLTTPLRQQRQAIAGVRMGASTAEAWPILGLYYHPGFIFDFTLGIALPQLERGARVTAPQRRLSI